MSNRVFNQIAQLERQLFPDDAWTAESIRDLLNLDINAGIILSNNALKKDSQLIGYCLYQVVFETAEILRIGVDSNLQNRGIGTQLFNQLLENLSEKKVENLLLEVREDNHKAMNFYQKHGFVTIHRRKNYYQTKNSGKMDALIMQKNLVED